jgi:hypothetical protein
MEIPQETDSPEMDGRTETGGKAKKRWQGEQLVH